ncbi:hypothetical protein MJO29_015308 [Puccinia striiformis f. sp. tritici]|nr:hypothetical protein MJO29_015308 [Puccinia striiformis f. sp. tritici]
MAKWDSKMISLWKSAFLVLLRVRPLSTTSTSEANLFEDVSSIAARQGPQEMDWQVGNIQTDRIPKLFQFLPTSPGSQLEHDFRTPPPSSAPKTLDLLAEDSVHPDLNVHLHLFALDQDALLQPASKKLHPDSNLHLLAVVSGQVADGHLGSSHLEIQHNVSPISSETDQVIGSEVRERSVHHQPWFNEKSTSSLRGGISPSPTSNSESRPFLAQKDASEELQGADTLSQNPVSSLPGTIAHGSNSALDLAGTSPSTDVRVIREFAVAKLNPKIWPWISVIWERVRRQISQELQDNLNPLIRTTTDEYLSHPFYRPGFRNSERDERPDEEAHRLKNEIKEIRTISHQLWAVNLRVLQILGVDGSDASYLEEQNKLLQWFVGFVLMRLDPSVPHLPHQLEQNHGQSFCNIRESLYRKLSTAVHSTDNEVLYTINLPWKGFAAGPIEVTQAQDLTNQAVVDLLGFYYKNTNHKKYDHLFGEDKYFVIKIANFGHGWTSKPLRISKAEAEKRNGGKVIPWETPLPETALRSETVKAKRLIFAFEKHVYPRKPADPEAMPEFIDSHVFHLGPQDARLWAWISRMKLQADIEAPPEYRQTTTLMEIRNYLQGQIEKRNLQHTVKLELQSITSNEKILSEKLVNLFNFIWSINTRILESMGCDRSEGDFLSEQKLVQMYFRFILSKLSKGRDDITEGESVSMNNLPINEHQGIIFEDLIIKYLLQSKRNVEQLYQVKNTDQATAVYSTITSEHLTMAEITCQILGNYYKNGNYKKWNIVFQTDQCLFDFLVRISSTKFHPGKSSKFKDKFFDQFKAYQLFPWNTESEHSLKFLSIKIRRWFARGSGSSMYKWLEHFPRKG